MSSPSAKRRSELVAYRAAALLAVATLLAYANSFGGCFIFDDSHSILENARIRSFPPAAPWGTRWLVELTLSLNYALGGYSAAGYHAVNLGIHILAALTLYGLVRRTLRRLPGDHRYADA